MRAKDALERLVAELPGSVWLCAVRGCRSGACSAFVPFLDAPEQSSSH